ncbi:hypothetical protein T4D_14245 [Trichinella pseudospiralis]|uniref:Uncharacterized protein n=1 Tax=Trichinella pseudospiralis TaxID=6337 RepID=A0A0V1FVU6_TRIPS|nr:hypothetical protein T4D_14245 [Trichinella pseudospiralis]
MAIINQVAAYESSRIFITVTHRPHICSIHSNHSCWHFTALAQTTYRTRSIEHRLTVITLTVRRKADLKSGQVRSDLLTKQSMRINVTGMLDAMQPIHNKIFIASAAPLS